VARHYWPENPRNRPQARREPRQVRPRTAEEGPAQRGAGAPSGDATVKLAMSASTLALHASSGSDPRINSGPLFRPPMRPLVGIRPGSGMYAHRHNRVLVHTYAVASPKGPLLPRFGAHTWRGFVTQHGVDSRRVFGRELVGQDTRWRALICIAVAFLVCSRSSAYNASRSRSAVSRHYVAERDLPGPTSLGCIDNQQGT